jgi:hypothetical protein
MPSILQYTEGTETAKEERPNVRTSGFRFPHAGKMTEDVASGRLWWGVVTHSEPPHLSTAGSSLRVNLLYGYSRHANNTKELVPSLIALHHVS